MWRYMAAATLLAACGEPSSTTSTSTTASAPAATWATVRPPTVTGSTDPVTFSNGKLADGTYWATLSPVSGSGDLVFTVARAYFGADCTTWAAERGMTEGCPNDYAVDDSNTALVAMNEGSTASVAAATGPGTNYSITAETLRGLFDGTSSSPVPGYQWTPFPFLVSVRNGFVLDARQFWVP